MEQISGYDRAQKEGKREGMYGDVDVCCRESENRKERA